MQASAWIVAGIAFGFAAAFAAAYGSVKAVPLVPSGSEKMSVIINALGKALESLQGLVTYLLRDVERHGEISGGPDKPPLQLYNQLVYLSKTLEKWVPQIPKPYDFVTEATHAAGVRLWLVAAFILAFASATCQVIGLLQPRTWDTDAVGTHGKRQVQVVPRGQSEEAVTWRAQPPSNGPNPPGTP